MNARPEPYKSTTPAGEFRYPKLNEYDEYKDQKKYKVDLVLTEDKADLFREQLSEVYAEAEERGNAEFVQLKPAMKKKFGGEVTMNPLGVEEYDDEDEETGRVIFKFKTNAYSVKGRLKKIAMFSPQGKRLNNVQVWGGTIGKVSFSAVPYFNNSNGQAGVTLYLNGVQILELVSGGAGRSAADHGFGAEEGYDEIEDGEADDAGETDASDGFTNNEEDNPDF